MLRATSSALALTAAAVLTFGTGCTTAVSGTAAPGVAPAAQGSGDPVAWTGKVCDSVQPLVEALGSAPDPSKATSPNALVRDISDYYSKAETAAGTARTDIEAVGPSPIAGGDDVVTRMSDKLSKMETDYRDAKTRVDDVDVDDREALLREVPAAVASLDELGGMPDLTTELLSNPELLRAGMQAPSCQQIERELGG